MTEAEWLACTDPTQMLEFLQGRASDRKLRLFACARCRRIWRSLRKKRSRRAIEVAEQYAEGIADVGKLEAAHAAAYDAYMDADGDSIEEFATGIAADVAVPDAGEAAGAATKAADVTAHVAVYGMDPLAPPPSDANEAAYRALQSTEQTILCCLLRCIFGNPLHPSPPLAHAILGWNDGTVRRIAEGIYAERAFARLPVLAGALLDAGCDNEELLAHCRSEGPHVKGCWAVDLILGRQ
jgi:hypothetical protein